MDVRRRRRGGSTVLLAASVAAAADDTILHVLGVKVSANDGALQITNRRCGSAAGRRSPSIYRRAGFPRRQGRCGGDPTANALYDFYGKAITGLPLF